MGLLTVNRTSLLDAQTPAIAPVGEAPKMQKYETFEQKLYRKFSQEPLIPIGCVGTAYFLVSGLHSFYNRDASRSQKMMRFRVMAQFATLMIFVGYYGLQAFDTKLAPMYYNAKALKEEHQAQLDNPQQNQDN